MKFGNQFLIATAILGSFLSGAVLQQNDGQNNDDKNLERISQLEKRLDLVEQVVFATAKLDATEATRNLQTAKERYEHSRKLFTKGFISESQIQNDRLLVQLAEKELELAKSGTGSYRLVSELDVLAAKQKLQLAEEDLERQTQLARRGYVSKDELDQTRREVELANLALKRANQNLTIATQMEAIKRETGQEVGNGKAKESEEESADKKK